MKHPIEWERFVDPLMPFTPDEFDPPDGEEEDYEVVRRAWADKERPKISPYRGPWFGTPAGIIPLGNHNAPSKTYKLWIGHTKYHVSESFLDRVNETEGVEVVKPISPYRFLLGIAKHPVFETEEVKKNVENIFLHLYPEPMDQVHTVESRLPLFEHWAVIELRPGVKEYCVGHDEEDVRRRAAAHLGKVVSASWEKKNG